MIKNIIGLSIKKICYSMAKISANTSSSFIAHQPNLPKEVEALKNVKIIK